MNLSNENPWNPTDSAISHYFLCTLETICTLAGTPLNTLLLVFHLTQQPPTTTSLLYVLLNCSDLLTCLLTWPAVASCWAHSRPLLFTNPVFREGWLVLWEVAGRWSVFLVGLQSIRRTVILLRPFSRRVGKQALLGIVAGYGVLLLAIQSVRLFYRVWSSYSPRVHRPNFAVVWLQFAMGFYAPETALFLVCNAVFGYVIPFLPICVSCAISVHVMMKRGRRASSSSRRATENKRDATKTILLLTATYIVTNTPLFLYDLNEILVTLSLTTGVNFVLISWGGFLRDHYSTYVFLYTVCYNLCGLLNSTLNGFIFLCRTRALKKFTRRLWSVTAVRIRDSARKIRPV